MLDSFKFQSVHRYNSLRNQPHTKHWYVIILLGRALRSASSSNTRILSQESRVIFVIQAAVVKVDIIDRIGIYKDKWV